MQDGWQWPTQWAGPLKTTTQSLAVERLLEKGCARNIPAELIHEHRNGTVTTARVRLLQLTPGHILTDRPLCMEGDAQIPTGVPVTVHLMLNGSRFQFETIVEEGDRLVRLNARQRVPGIAMRKPTAVRYSQRRANLRVSVVGYDPISVRLVRPHPMIADACLLDGQVITGWILDVSAGGLSVLVDRRVLQSSSPGERFYLDFALPGVEDDFCMLGIIRHCQVVVRSDSLRLGIGFLPWRDTAWKRDQRRLSRFIVDHERRLLRRRK